MNVRLRTSISFVAGVFFEGILRMNNYRVSLSMTTNSGSSESYDIALDRMKYFIGECIDSGVFINEDNTDQCKKFIRAGVKLVTLPEEPVEQIIGMMLYCKLNAIAENHIIVNEVEISSELGDQVVFFHSDGEFQGPFADAGWWHQPDLTHYNKELNVKDNIMSMSRRNTWKDLELDWPIDTEALSGNTIVFADFGRDETK
jgi:hypothetical protein